MAVNFALLQNKEPDEPAPAITKDPEDKRGKKRKAEEDEEGPEDESIVPTPHSRRELLFILGYIREHFSDIYKENMKGKKVGKLTDAQLEILIDEMKFEIGISTASILNVWTFNLVCKAVEKCGVEVMTLRIQGIAQVMTHDPEAALIWHEMNLNYIHLCHIDPKWKFIGYIIKTAYLMHTANTKMDEVSKQLDEGAAEQVQQALLGQTEVEEVLPPIVLQNVAGMPTALAPPNEPSSDDEYYSDDEIERLSEDSNFSDDV